MLTSLQSVFSYSLFWNSISPYRVYRSRALGPLSTLISIPQEKFIQKRKNSLSKWRHTWLSTEKFLRFLVELLSLGFSDLLIRQHHFSLLCLEDLNGLQSRLMSLRKASLLRVGNLHLERPTRRSLVYLRQKTHSLKLWENYSLPVKQTEAWSESAQQRQEVMVFLHDVIGKNKSDSILESHTSYTHQVSAGTRYPASLETWWISCWINLSGPKICSSEADTWNHMSSSGPVISIPIVSGLTWPQKHLQKQQTRISIVNKSPSVGIRHTTCCCCC